MDRVAVVLQGFVCFYRSKHGGKAVDFWVLENFWKTKPSPIVGRLLATIALASISDDLRRCEVPNCIGPNRRIVVEVILGSSKGASNTYSSFPRPKESNHTKLRIPLGSSFGNESEPSGLVVDRLGCLWRSPLLLATRLRTRCQRDRIPSEPNVRSRVGVIVLVIVRPSLGTRQRNRAQSVGRACRNTTSAW